MDHSKQAFVNFAPYHHERSRFHLLCLLTIMFVLSIPSSAQNLPASAPQPGKIMGTVIDVNGNPVAGAVLTLTNPDPADSRTVVTGENGFFQLDAVQPGNSYQLTVSAPGFADWKSPAIALAPGQSELLDTIHLQIAAEHTTVEVKYDPVEIATEQFKGEEKQRILGFIPNFYVAYDSDAEPLSTQMKFRLAVKVSYDPVSIAGVAFVAGLKQAADSPKYGQGAQGYAKRLGATAADGFTDIMIGGAILPSLLHQDPRYFYKGTGSTKSRIRHALLAPFVAKGDNGKWQPNYSSVGGDLASSAISNLYYPRADRGAGLVFSGFAIQTAERMGATLAQEFLLGRLTRRGGHIQ